MVRYDSFIKEIEAQSGRCVTNLQFVESENPQPDGVSDQEKIPGWL